MKFIAEEISLNTFINIMDQYRPCWKADQFPELARAITYTEYDQALEIAQKTGLRRICNL